MRWLDWGARSYHDFALGLALLLIAAAIVGAAGVPRPIAYVTHNADGARRHTHT
jgi:hypothetical protein